MNRKAMNLLLLITALAAVSFLFIGDAVDADDERLTSEYTYSEGILTVSGTTMEGTKVINLTVNVSENVKIPAFADIDESNWTYSAKIKCTLVDNATLTVEAQRLNEAKVTKNIDLVIKQTVVDVTGIEINQLDKEISLYVGDSATLRYEIKPSNATDKTVIWSSDKPNIASVDPKTGAIKANAAGNAVITATAGGKTDTAKVKVLNIPTTDPSYTFDIRIEFHTNKLNLGQSGYDLSALKRGITLTATGKDAGAALEKALKDNKIPCSFFSGSSGGESLQHWVNHIFGMGDTHFDNGVWMYWVQYHNGSYNDKTLGYYKEGGSFELVYGMTAGDSSTASRIQPVSLPKVTRTYTGNDIVGLSDSTAYVVVSGGTGKEVGSYDAVLRLRDGYAWEDATFADKSVRWTIEQRVDESSATNSDGSRTDITTKTDENGTIVTETTTNSTKDKNGNTTDTKDVTVTTKDKDGNITGSTKTKEEVVKDKDGNITQSSIIEVVKDKDGNVSGSTEEVTNYTKDTDEDGNVLSVESNVSTQKDGSGNVTALTEKTEVKDKDGKIIERSEIKKDASGNEIYSKSEEYVPETARVEGDVLVTESSSRITEMESGTTTVKSESSTETVSADGWTETETVKEQSVTGADGKTASSKIVETVTQYADGDKIVSVATEAVSSDGKKTSERTVAAESADGTVRSDAEVSEGSADIVTVVDAVSAGGAYALSKEQAEQAVSLQEKVSGAISDVPEQTKVIKVESAASAGSLTVAHDVIETVAESGSSLMMSSSAGSLTVSSEVLSNISQEDEVTIFVSAANDQDMSGAQKSAVADAVAVDVRIMSGDRSLGSQLDGTVTISVRYTPADGKVAVAYYIADDGSRERMGGVYDPERGEVTFNTTHCSIYAIFDEDVEPVDEGGSNTMQYIGAAAVAVVLIAIAAVLISRRS